MNLLVLTTVPHFFTLVYTKGDLLYNTLIITSTFFSILWHLNNEPENLLKKIDYIFALLVVIKEFYSKNFFTVLVLNTIVLVINKKTSCRYTGHCLWHLLSSAKCIYIASL
jgi:hypothetical protein